MNQCNFTGNLTRDAEQRTSNGDSKKDYVVFTLAVQDDFDKKQVDFIDFQIWGNRGKYMAQYGKKGMKVEVSGGKYKTYIKDGVKYSYISVGTYAFIGKKEETKTEPEQETAF